MFGLGILALAIAAAAILAGGLLVLISIITGRQKIGNIGSYFALTGALLLLVSFTLCTMSK